MEPVLTMHSFDQFFAELHGQSPFPWQSRLAASLSETGLWPDIAVPTAAGKTATIDIALYHLALEASRPSAQRRAPRRVFFIVDRRVVVDDAYRRALAIAARLKAENTNGAIGWVANQLRRYGGLEPLAVEVLRGGIYRDEQWFRDPLQPTVIVSTVDQVGSRILFRGYGCSPRTWPIHAALTGNDALFLLDEAHLSQPFEQTLASLIARSVADRARNGWGLPLQMASITATAASEKEKLREDGDDLKHPILAKRLQTSKPALLVKVATTKLTAKMRSGQRTEIRTQNRRLMALEMTAMALKVAEGAQSLKVAVMVNEVALARMIHDSLVAASQRSILVIGRSRPLDRWNLFDAPEAPAKAVRTGMPSLPREAGPLFVVSTQCLEVGADLDFDALITECAALDALRQRFGRLARLGRELPAPAVIVAASDQVASGFIHPVYGAALPSTWEWLNRQAAKAQHPCGKGPVVEFSHTALAPRLPKGDELKALLTPREDAPLLLDHHLEAWAQTSPAPAAEPEIAVFLHGPTTGAPEVNVIWRDLPADNPETWADLLEALPPISSEALPLPRHQLIRWLASQAEEDLFDTDSSPSPEDAPDEGRPLRFPIICLRPEMPPKLCRTVEDVERSRSGDTLVLPCAAGGCDAFGWAPDSSSHVLDYTFPARLLQRHELLVEVTLEDEDAEPDELVAKVLIRTSAPSPVHALYKSTLASVVQGNRARWISTALPTPSQVLLQLRGRVTPSATGEGSSQEWREDSTSRKAARSVGLLDHLNDVRSKVASYSSTLGLPEAITATLNLAAILHDVGKADPDFQALLGNLDLSPGRLLAKSDRHGGSIATRHEALSVDMARTALAPKPEPFLLHLIASHHGYGRPLFLVADAAAGRSVDLILHLPDGHELRLTGSQGPALYRIDSGQAVCYAQCNRTLGPHALAMLETLLRLADWNVSSSY